MSRFLGSTVVACVAAHAGSTPDKTALVVSDEEVSYARLWECVSSFASRLREAGVSRGDRVALRASHSLSYVSAYLAVTLLGAIAVPYESGLPDDGVVELATRVGARVAVAPRALEGVGSTIPEDSVIDDAPSAFDWRNSLPEPDDLAELLLTTGTTGRSKVVTLSHRAIMSVIENIVTATGILEDNVSLVPMPLNHVFGLRRLQTGLVVGATVVLIDGVASLKRFYKALSSYHVTSLSLVPSALAYIQRTTKDYLGKYAEQIRYVESSSAPLPGSTRAWLRSVLPSSRLYNSYGCTESTACCMLEYSHRDDDGACVGAPCATAEIRILDVASGEELTEGSGRIAIGGTGVMEGYWGDEEVTGVALHGGLVYTNDLGYLRNGELYVRGRIDDVAIIGGNNVSPVEVEDVISRCAVVADCACVKGHDDVSGDRLVLFVAWAPGSDEASARSELTSFMRGRLEAYKVPSDVRTLPEIPRTYNGKIDRKPLAALLEEGEA